MSQTIGQATYYDFKELRRIAKDLADSKQINGKHVPATPKARLLRYELKVTNMGASVVAWCEPPDSFTVERAVLL